jgi:hypothetical protein
VIAAADHGFCDGASHQRRDLYRQSPYDSGVFVLQSSRGAAKWKLQDRFEQVGWLGCVMEPPRWRGGERHARVARGRF